MNKRIKKKQIKRAFRNLANGEPTKKDLHVLKTIGKNEFMNRVGVTIQELPAAIEEAKTVVYNIVEAMTELIKPLVVAMAEVFRKVGEHEEETTVQEKEVQEQESHH